ncbi:hypothetical protein SMB554_06960 [Sinorhizobium meliloti]|nr:hypothetical protein SMB554_06960 [Sinorhizobium meliloti]
MMLLSWRLSVNNEADISMRAEVLAVNSYLSIPFTVFPIRPQKTFVALMLYSYFMDKEPSCTVSFFNHFYL